MTAVLDGVPRFTVRLGRPLDPEIVNEAFKDTQARVTGVAVYPPSKASYGFDVGFSEMPSVRSAESHVARAVIRRPSTYRTMQLHTFVEDC